MHVLFSLIFDDFSEYFFLYIFVVALCIVHCVTCFLYINLRLSFPEKIKKNDPKTALHAKRDTYEERRFGGVDAPPPDHEFYGMPASVQSKMGIPKSEQLNANGEPVNVI